MNICIWHNKSISMWHHAVLQHGCFYSNRNQYSFMQASFYIIVRNGFSMNFSIHGSSAWRLHVHMVHVTALDIQVSLCNPRAMMKDSMTSVKTLYSCHSYFSIVCELWPLTWPCPGSSWCTVRPPWRWSAGTWGTGRVGPGWRCGGRSCGRPSPTPRCTAARCPCRCAAWSQPPAANGRTDIQS